MYWFPDNVPLGFTSIRSIPEVDDQITARVYGSEGSVNTDYYTGVWRHGQEVYQGKNQSLDTTGAQNNIREFHQFITEGRCDNPTGAPSVRSNLTSILGREAAYRKTELTLAALLKENRKLEFNLAGLKS